MTVQNLNPDMVEKLKNKITKIKINTLNMVYKAQSGHLGGAFSSAEIITVLYYYFMKIDPKNPNWEDRDRFILSKGHACPILYAVLADKGFFPFQECSTLRSLNSRLQGHPDVRKCPGIDATTGSLGEGLSIGVGMALAAKKLKNKYKIYVIIGDGESQEGQIWEAAMSASKYKLNNLIVFTDYNNIQVDGFVNEVMPIEPIKDKWIAFGWHVQEINGNNIKEIIDAVENAYQDNSNKPHMIIAHTIKGKGVSFMENKPEWHSGAPDEEQYMQALKELEASK